MSYDIIRYKMPDYGKHCNKLLEENEKLKQQNEKRIKALEDIFILADTANYIYREEILESIMRISKDCLKQAKEE